MLYLERRPSKLSDSDKTIKDHSTTQRGKLFQGLYKILSFFALTLTRAHLNYF